MECNRRNCPNWENKECKIEKIGIKYCAKIEDIPNEQIMNFEQEFLEYERNGLKKGVIREV